MKKVKIWLTTAATLLLGVALTACGNNNGAANKKHLNWMTNASISSLDPSKAVDLNTQQTIFNSFSGLVEPNGGNKVRLGVAKDYHISKDGKTYTFDLKHTKWSNGKDLTAQDFAYGIQRSADPKTASQEAYYMDHIVNYDAVSKEQAPVSSLGVKAVGKYKLQFKLTRPQPYFVNILTLPVFYPQLKSEVDKYGSSYGTTSDKMVYNGAFKVTKWNGTNDSWVLAKNPYYYDAKQTKLSTIKYTVIKDPQTALNEYQNGKIDQTYISGKQGYANYKNDKDFHLRKSYTVKYITMNAHAIPALNNKNIRQAMSAIINRKELINDVLGDGSIQARGMVPDTLAYRNGKDFNDVASVSSAVNGDAKRAQAQWKQGLKEMNMKSLHLTLTGGNDDTTKSMAEFLQSEWSKLPGMHVNVQLLPNTVSTSRFLHSQFQVHVAAWDPSISDPISPLNTKYTGNSMNTAKWSNANYDDLLDKSNNEDALKPAKRWDDLVNAQKVLLNDQAIIPLYQSAQGELIKHDIHGIKYYGNGPLWDFSKAYVK